MTCETFTLFCNVLLAMFVFTLCRVVFYLVNYNLYENIEFSRVCKLFLAGTKFDLTAVLYLNILLIIFFALPCHMKSKVSTQIGRIYFVVANSIGVVMNMCDVIYARFTGRRTTCTVFDEFSNEDNLAGIFADEIANNWYLLLFAIAMGALLYFGYSRPKYVKIEPLWKYYTIKTILFVLIVDLTINGIRGGFGHGVRPITMSNVNQYINKQTEAPLVLNTPFSMIRSVGKSFPSTPIYYSPEELPSKFSPIRIPNDTIPFQPKNVVVLIWESFSREYVGSLSRTLENNYRGYTPFIDSLLTKSLTFKYSYANGRKSIDAMPAILSSLPRIYEPLVLSPYSMDKLGGLAYELGKKDYYSAFFHGAHNLSMGFQAFARGSGFKDYFGIDEFLDDGRFGDMSDYDGTWAIWDENFLQFFAHKMNDFKQPFLSGVFTATSHPPFVLPEQYKDTFPDDGVSEIHKTIRYADHAFRRFFETVSKEVWYQNTIFILTADHAVHNDSQHFYAGTDLGVYCIPIIIFDPSGQLPTGVQDKIVSQMDIMPTVLGLLHYDQPYIAYGHDVLNTPNDELYSFNHNGMRFQYVRDGHFIQFDGTKTDAVYALSDSMQTHNLVGSYPRQKEFEDELKGMIQDYMTRLKEDKMVY